MNIDYNLLITAILLVASAILHEIMHGYVANYLGDDTAKIEGRLTFNPLKHIDNIGSVIVPAFLMYLKAGYVFAWAKPVPFNENKLEDARWGSAFVGISGPATNLVLALLGGVLIRFSDVIGISGHPVLLGVVVTFILLNIVLAFFNLIPLPPLDGHHVSFAIFGDTFPRIRDMLTSYWPFFLVPVMVIIWMYSGPVIEGIFSIIVGAAV